MAKKRSILKIKCPRCKKAPIKLEERGTILHGTYFLEDGKIDWHTLSPDTFYPTEVIATCECKNEWRLKGISSMEGIEEYESYESYDDAQNK